MADLDWNLIRSFIAVAETGSLSAAARRLTASQPTLGRHVAELEQALGVVLFRRGRRGYELTEQGIALFERAQAVGEAANAFARLAAGATEQVAGSVRIAASEVVSAYVLPPIMARLGLEEPAIEVEIVASNQVENLLRRDADIAVRMVAPAQQDLVARKIADLPLVACAARSYLDRRGRPEKPEDMFAHDVIGYDRASRHHPGLRRAGLQCRSPRISISNRQSDRLLGGDPGRQRHRLRAAPARRARSRWSRRSCPGSRCPSLPMWLAMHRDVRTSARVRRVADFLFAELKRYAAA